MKTRLMILVIACLWAATATGQIDPNSDGIGIYADLEGLTNQVELEAGVPMEVYLLLTRPSGIGMFGGWECSLVVPDNVTIWGWNITTPGALVLGNPPDFMAGFPAIEYQTVNLLMTFIIVPLDSEPGQFYITDNQGPNSGDEPRYVDMDDGHEYGSTLINMRPYPDGVGKASFTVNPEAVPTTSATWGDVKALYR